MIRYTKDSLCTVLYWWGGINREILPKALVYSVFLTSVYFLQVYGHLDLKEYTDTKLFDHTLKGILSFLVFLLVFRLNQCMSRHYAAVALVTDLFHCLERLAVDLCIHLRGDAPGAHVASHAGSHHEPHREIPVLSSFACSSLAIAAKVNCIRLIIAYAVSMVLHFQLLDAAADSNGVLDDLEIQQVVFLYCRLRCLLYDEEMHILDSSLSVLRDLENGEVVYRSEINRYRLLGDPGCEQLIGYPEKDRCASGVTVCPAPKLVMNILLRALQKPSDQQWGYESRLWNLFWRDTLQIINTSLHLESIIMSPTPLPYLQHGRMLFLLFSFAFPSSMDVELGLVYNICLPLVIFWAIMGFEVLSGMLENPLGNDEVDMNLYEKIHSLEVNAEKIFDVTEQYQAPLFHALERTENLIMGEAEAEACREHVHQDPAREGPRKPTVRKPAADPAKMFRTYFQWAPMPTVMLCDLLDSHGEVESLHSLHLSLRHLFSGISVRKMLRQTLNRPTDGHTSHNYVKVEQSEAPKEEPVVNFNKDPNYFCHYLEFVGADGRANRGGSEKGSSENRLWKDRAAALLCEHQAGRLLAPIDSEDSQRSLMMQPRDDSRLQRMVGGWERLA